MMDVKTNEGATQDYEHELWRAGVWAEVYDFVASLFTRRPRVESVDEYESRIRKGW